MVIAIIHAVLIFASYISPFVLGWKIVAIFVAFYYLQLAVLGNCVLTMVQFREKYRTTSFYSYILERLGFRPDKRKVLVVVDYVVPWVILLIALLYQVALGKAVPVTF